MLLNWHALNERKWQNRTSQIYTFNKLTRLKVAFVMKIRTFQSKGNMAKLFLPSNKCIYIPVQLFDSFVVQFSIENNPYFITKARSFSKIKSHRKIKIIDIKLQKK